MGNSARTPDAQVNPRVMRAEWVAIGIDLSDQEKKIALRSAIQFRMAARGAVCGQLGGHSGVVNLIANLDSHGLPGFVAEPTVQIRCCKRGVMDGNIERFRSAAIGAITIHRPGKSTRRKAVAAAK